MFCCFLVLRSRETFLKGQAEGCVSKSSSRAKGRVGFESSRCSFCWADMVQALVFQRSFRGNERKHDNIQDAFSFADRMRVHFVRERLETMSPSCVFFAIL